VNKKGRKHNTCSKAREESTQFNIISIGNALGNAFCSVSRNIMHAYCSKQVCNSKRIYLTQQNDSCWKLMKIPNQNQSKTKAPVPTTRSTDVRCLAESSSTLEQHSSKHSPPSQTDARTDTDVPGYLPSGSNPPVQRRSPHPQVCLMHCSH